MKQLRQLIIVSVLSALTFSSVAYSEGIRSADEIQKTLDVLEKRQEELETAKRLLEDNKKMKFVMLDWAQAAISLDEKDMYWAKANKLEGEELKLRDDVKSAEENVKGAWEKYQMSIQWLTNLRRKAILTYTRIHKMDINPSNKRRALAAISNDIKELNGGLFSKGTKTLNEVATLIRIGRPLEEVKERLLGAVDDDAEKVIADYLIGLMNEAIKRMLGEDAILNKIDSQLGKVMKLVKVARILEDDKQDIDRVVDLLDLTSDLVDLVPDQFIPVAYYIKIQKFMVEQIARDIEKWKLAIAPTNLQNLLEIVTSKGSERIRGDRQKWTGMNPTALFGTIPPEPQLSLKKVVYKPGDPIIVSFEGSSNWVSRFGNRSKGWIGLIPSHVAHGSSDENDAADLEYRYMTEEFGTENFTAPKTPGSYDIRMFDSDPGAFQGDGIEVAFITIQVVADKPVEASVAVDARANSSSGGQGKDTGIDVAKRDVLIVNVDPNDDWSAGSDQPCTRKSNADGLTKCYGPYSMSNLSANFGSLVGRIGDGPFFFIGTSYENEVTVSGRLRFYYWDSNSGDNSGFITANLVVKRRSGLKTEKRNTAGN